jgi:glycosyltransferase involved in cell wall biosynthesis
MPTADSSDPPVRVTVVTPCFNESENVAPLFAAVDAVFAAEPGYTHTHLFIDNASTDGTDRALRAMAAADPRVRVILNARNFGHIRSPMHGILQADGTLVLSLAADFQDPPELIPQFLRQWEKGFKVVLGVKEQSDEPRLMYAVRSFYYRLVTRMSAVELPRHVTGFGLYDRQVVEVIRQIGDPYPYFRGLIADIGFPAAKIPFRQPNRRFGITKNNFYTLYDLAMLGITNHSKVPLRLMTMGGFAMAAASLFLALAYLAAKIVYWDWLGTPGIAPIIISLFFLSSVQLFFLGLLGEYIGAIHTQVQRRPLVIERERINFGPPSPPPPPVPPERPAEGVVQPHPDAEAQLVARAGD